LFGDHSRRLTGYFGCRYFFQQASSKIEVATSKISHDNEKLGSFLLVAASHIVHTERIQQRTAKFLAQAKKERKASFSLMNDRHST
jgi:hypothetical protein